MDLHRDGVKGTHRNVETFSGTDGPADVNVLDTNTQ